MNAMRYDAMVIGNHEPDFTAQVLSERMGEAAFPLLAANIRERAGGKPFARPYVIREVGGVRVGILGLAYPNTPLTTARRNVEGLEFLPAVESARRFVPRMRSEGAQVVIALTHLGLGADRALAEKVDGIDVIVGGHSHNRMPEALRVRDTLIVQAGAHGSDLGRLDLVLRDGRIVEHRRTLIPLTGEGSDARSRRSSIAHLQPLRGEMSRPVGPRPDPDRARADAGRRRSRQSRPGKRGRQPARGRAARIDRRRDRLPARRRLWRRLAARGGHRSGAAQPRAARLPGLDDAARRRGHPRGARAIDREFHHEGPGAAGGRHDPGLRPRLHLRPAGAPRRAGAGHRGRRSAARAPRALHRGGQCAARRGWTPAGHGRTAPSRRISSTWGRPVHAADVTGAGTVSTAGGAALRKGTHGDEQNTGEHKRQRPRRHGVGDVYTEWGHQTADERDERGGAVADGPLSQPDQRAERGRRADGEQRDGRGLGDVPSQAEYEQRNGQDAAAGAGKGEDESDGEPEETGEHYARFEVRVQPMLEHILRPLAFLTSGWRNCVTRNAIRLRPLHGTTITQLAP